MGDGGGGGGGYRRSVRCSQSVASFFRNEGKLEGGRGGRGGRKNAGGARDSGRRGKKNRDHRRRVEFSARRHFIPLLAVAVFFFSLAALFALQSVRYRILEFEFIVRCRLTCHLSDSMRKGFPSRVLSSLFCINCSIKWREEFDLLLFNLVY